MTLGFFLKAVVLLSGGLDSSTVLHQAKADGMACYALSFDYQQRHRQELEAAFAIAKSVGVVDHQCVNFDLRQWGGSALTDASLDLPEDRPVEEMAVMLSGRSKGISFLKDSDAYWLPRSLWTMSLP